jgi:hypothetical protein
MGKLTENEFLKGLHDPRDRRSRNELFKQVGRIIVTLSEIENLMATAFFCVSQGMTIEESKKLFYSYRGFDQRFKLVGYAIAQNDWGGEIEAWNALAKKVESQRFVRNFAAHNQVSFKEDKKKGKRIASLATSEFKKDRTEIDVIDLKKAADTLEKIEAEIHLFVEQLLPANKP